MRLLEELFRKLPDKLDEFEFVDYGPGKGRVLLAASRLPFKRIIGVEFATELHETASHNIEVHKDPTQQCHDIHSTYIGAREFEISGDKCELFF